MPLRTRSSGLTAVVAALLAAVVAAVAAALLAALLVVPTVAQAQKPHRAAAPGFRLYARALSDLRINRVVCGLSASGDVCANAGGYDTYWGALWPKDSPQGYIFNSGMQVAGAIDDAGGWAWAGDTTGAFFYDTKGTTQHGQEVEPIWNYADSSDRAHWPAAANVPEGDASAALFDPSLRGRPSASEGDVWSLMWEGDPALIAGRPHPLGIAVETRGLGWNYPAGNGDIIYFVHTFYNISSGCAADYSAIRPAMRAKLLALGQQFQTLNNTKFGIQIPACGYAIKDLWFGSTQDADVSSDAGNNYGSVNLPLQLGYSYEDSFRRTDGAYVLPNGLGDPPFLSGYGFVGFKFLQTPLVNGQEPEIHLFTVMVGGGGSPQASNVFQLYRLLSGQQNPVLGDGLCNFNQTLDRVCYIKNDGHADVRTMLSTGPAELPPGGSVSIVMAYVFASAVAIPTCATPGCPSVVPGDPRWLSNVSQLTTAGANRVDSIAGYRGFVDANADGKVQGSEFIAVRGSLIQKAQLAQAIFDSHFLLSAAPESPAFFLVPGDNSVGVFWRPSATEATGDPFFSAASSPAGPAYDPNFRQFDVEGYRIYRGRLDDPTALTLLAQFDYAGTVMKDYLGAVQPRPTCAPELGLSATPGCLVNFSTPTAGTAYTVFTSYDISYSPLVQVRLGDRFLKATGQVFITAADTAVTGGATRKPPLEDTGVPFVYLDKTVKNNLRYFYAVTAFDVNSIQSGPSSLESARLTKGATPVAPGSNYDNKGSLAIGMFGRGVNMTEVRRNGPTINSTTGVFSGPARVATGAQIGFVGDFIAQVVTQSGETSLTLDSMDLGSAYDLIPTTYWFTVTSPTGSVPTSVPVVQDQFNGSVSLSGTMEGPPVDDAAAQRYGGDGGFHFSFTYDLSYPGNYYTNSYGRGCINAAPGFNSARCAYNGARWFSGATETFAHPNQGNASNGAAPIITNFTNAGSLTGVSNVYEAKSYETRPNLYRSVEGAIGGAATAADYKVFWNTTTGGVVDSVVDITHNVRLPFNATMARGYTWGFLNTASTGAAGSGDARPGVLSVTDLGCVAPLHGEAGVGTGVSYAAADGHLGCAAATHYHFDNTPQLGQIAIGNNVANDGVILPRPNNGLGMYLAGHFFLFEMAAPAALPVNAVWTLRTYTGAISGGGGAVGAAGNLGSYQFSAQTSPFTAVGASLKAVYTVTNNVHLATRSDLDRVHTIPDPYYRTNAWESDPAKKVIKFVNLPTTAIIRIYTTSGILVRVIEHHSTLLGGEEDWDVRNRDGRLAASGVYFYHIETGDTRRVGRMTIVTDGR